MAKGLSPKRARFVSEYLIDLNGTQAAIRAGYSPKTANEQAARLLADVSISAEVAAGKAELAKKQGVTKEWLVQKWKKIHRIGVKAEMVMDRQGNPTGEYKAVDLAAANKALEHISKITGQSEPERVDVTTKGDKLEGNKTLQVVQFFGKDVEFD